MATRRKILLVEDQALIALKEARSLERHGFEVIIAYDAQQAICLAGESGVDLVLMDIDLGEGRMSGTEAAEIILDNQEIPVIFLTGHAEKEMVEKVKGITRYGYVIKNSGEFVLVESINMAFELFESYREIKAREKKLEENRIKFEAVFHQSIHYLAIVDLDGTVLQLNELTLRSNYRASESVGSSVFDAPWWSDEARESLKKNFKKAAEGCSVTDECVYYGPKENRRYAIRSYHPIRDNAGEMCFVVIQGVDITDRMVESSGRASLEDVYRSIIQTSMDGVIVLDRDGSILNTNQSYCRMSGYTSEELISLSVLQLEAKETGKEALEHIGSIQEKGSDRFRSYHRRKDGSVYPVEVSCNVLPGNSGFVACIRDMSETQEGKAS